MKTRVKIKGCYLVCPFFGNDIDGMFCYHPCWKGNGNFASVIITPFNSKNGNIPCECPLRKEQLTVVYTLDDNDNL